MARDWRAPAYDVATTQLVERAHQLGLRDDPSATFRDDLGVEPSRPMTNGSPHLLVAGEVDAPDRQRQLEVTHQTVGAVISAGRISEVSNIEQRLALDGLSSFITASSWHLW